MPTLRNVQNGIYMVEGFNAIFTNKNNGRDIRDDLESIPQYNYDRKAKNDMTVFGWKQNRFYPNYPGYDVKVLDGNGNEVHGAKKLGNLRATYIKK